MKAVITVVGKDKIGILALMCNVCADAKVNILDVAQTILDGIFTMTMIVDTELMNKTLVEFTDELNRLGEENNLNIKLMNKDIFEAMHRI